MRREVVEGIGLLDEASPLYLDDIDYCRRIRDAGWQVHYVAEASITHFWKRSSSAFRREGDFYALGIHAIWLYLRKHDGSLAATIFCLMACFASPVRICVSSLGSIASKGEVRGFWKRQLNMAFGLTRWAFRIPKAPPRLGFAGEKSRGR
jgi:GT2 family glycosyltransferase